MLSDLPSGVLVALLVRIRLNAPYGAPCFLTYAGQAGDADPGQAVLMHLMALHAF